MKKNIFLNFNFLLQFLKKTALILELDDVFNPLCVIKLNSFPPKLAREEWFPYRVCDVRNMVNIFRIVVQSDSYVEY